jgi:hypothetical protein
VTSPPVIGGIPHRHRTCQSGPGVGEAALRRTFLADRRQEVPFFAWRRTERDAVCLRAVGGVAVFNELRAARPDALTPLHPPQLAATPSSHSDNEAVSSATELMRLDPIEFEDLVAALFRAMGMTTERSGDGGVDVRAMDRDPIRVGKLVIQAKRYSSTIPPAPVRDLLGTTLHEGVVKGILVTTAEFGPGAQQFAGGKPLPSSAGRNSLTCSPNTALSGQQTRPERTSTTGSRYPRNRVPRTGQHPAGLPNPCPQVQLLTLGYQGQARFATLTQVSASAPSSSNSVERC